MTTCEPGTEAPIRKSRMNQSEVILKVGAEGGTLSILGERTPAGDWRFQIGRNETAVYDMLSEDDQNGITPCEDSRYMGSFADAITLMDKYPWHMFYPVEVHPDFRELVFAAVVARFKLQDAPGHHRLSDWIWLCGVPRNESDASA